MIQIKVDPNAKLSDDAVLDLTIVFELRLWYASSTVMCNIHSKLDVSLKYTGLVIGRMFLLLLLDIAHECFLFACEC